jgi:hypothetical protein
LALPVRSGRGEKAWHLLHKRNASQEVAVRLSFGPLHLLESLGVVVLIPLGLAALVGVGSDNPEEAVISTEALYIHLAVRSGRQVDQRVQDKLLMAPEAAVVQAPETLDACGLITGKKEAVADACNGREILVERVF